MTEPIVLARSFVDGLNAERRETHAAVFKLTEDLTDAELRWRPGPHAPSIGFHVWHLARWADHDAAEITGRKQIWEVKKLGQAWNLPEALGDSETGTGMDDDVSTGLPLPGKTTLLAYANDAFAALEAATAGLSAALVNGMPLPVGMDADKAVSFLLEYPTHDNRHLGMIEALRGQLRDSGTATR
ncbi:MAG TPA: DinB family protein [Dehalococcoidia bacterium]|nr:DinB family protein [Dehalococcoidia bacterium]